MYCNALKKMFDDLGVEYRRVQADELTGAERERAVADLKKVNPICSFPTVVIGDEVVAGYKVQEIKEKLGVRTEVDDLFDRLKKINEPKGYFFNRDKEKTFALLRGLLINKDRYGYLACPCRLAQGDRERDQDIFCPCVYRPADIAEYGSCYCGLYVSKEWNVGLGPHAPVPERRPAERS